MTTYLYAILTDGTDTFTFSDNTASNNTADAGITSFLPGVARLRENSLNGAGEYDDVVMSIDFDIVASSAANVYAAYAKLKRLLDKADAWRRTSGEGTAVLFKWSPVGGTTSTSSDPLQAPILVRVSGDNTDSLVFPSEFPKSGNRYALRGVQLRVLRRGQWLHTEETATASTVTNGDIATLSFGAGLNVESPTKIEVTAASRLYNIPHRLIIAQSSSDLEIINAENMAGATGYTSASGSSEAARNTNVLRYTPTSTAGQWSSTTTYSSLPSSGTVLVFANVRTTSATAIDYLVQVSINSQTFISIPTLVTTATPRKWVSLGLLSYQRLGTISTKNIQVKITASATGTASDYLEIDSIVLVASKSTVRVCEYHGAATSATSAKATFDHRYLGSPTPNLALQSGIAPSIDYHPVFEDGSPFISTSAATVYGLILANGSDTTANTWRLASGSTADTSDWTLTRTKAYVTPV